MDRLKGFGEFPRSYKVLKLFQRSKKKSDNNEFKNVRVLYQLKNIEIEIKPCFCKNI